MMAITMTDFIFIFISGVSGDSAAVGGLREKKGLFF